MKKSMIVKTAMKTATVIPTNSNTSHTAGDYSRGF
jgi:hypothetical protein